MRIKASLYFLLFLLVVVAVVIISSAGMEHYESKLLPLIVGGITFVLIAVELWRELSAGKVEAETKTEEGADQEISRRTVKAIAWVLGATLGVYLIGFIAAITLFILAYLKKQGRSWQVSLAVAVITSALIYGIFQYILGFELYEGIIYNTIIR